MKRLRKGPELKLPELRVPDFLRDLYYDLRDRRLLPLVGLALVAIVAVPFLLAGEAEDEPPPLAGAGASAGASRAAELTVVQATPGLRDYRKRLRGRAASDPFKQRYTGSNLKGAKLAGEKGTAVSSTVTTTKTSTTKTESGTTTKTTKTKTADGVTTTKTKTESSPVPGADGGADGGGSSPAGQPQPTPYGFAVDVKITRSTTSPTGAVKRVPSEREAVVAPAPLPSAAQQVVTYMGINPRTREPLLLVSDEVSAVFGEGKCLSGSARCQLLEVETGMPVTFVFGPDSVRYKLNLTKVEPVAAGKP